MAGVGAWEMHNKIDQSIFTRQPDFETFNPRRWGSGTTAPTRKATPLLIDFLNCTNHNQAHIEIKVPGGLIMAVFI